MSEGDFRSLEVCAGTGGLALGLEQAGFSPVMLVDDDHHPCATLRQNRPGWRVLQTDLRDFVGSEHDGVSDVDLLCGGPPSAPYSVAGKQDGFKDERDLLRAMIYLAMDVRPRALLIENTPTLLTHPKFNDTRTFVMEELQHLGYRLDWQVLNAKDFGVPQTRRSGFIIALRPSDFARFIWPSPNTDPTPTLGQALYESMAERGWAAVDEWARMARRVAPTIVGGSKKHGGADLGPTRTKRMWAELGVNAHSLADRAPDPDFPFLPEIGRDGLPKLTVPQVARLQGFPADWLLAGGKTARYKQVAQSVPPPLAAAVGRRIARALRCRPPLDDASRPDG